MLADLLTDPVTIERKTVVGRDPLGADILNWVTVSPINLRGRLATPALTQSGDELLTDRDTVVIRRILDLPVGTDIQPFDRAIVGGSAYEVDGAPDSTPISPMTGIGYVSAMLRRVTDG